MKKTHFSSNLFKNKDFLKIYKSNDDLNYLAKFVEKHFSNTHFGASESAKTLFDVTKVENFDKKYFFEKEPEKSI
jgi:hypothetical protein